MFRENRDQLQQELFNSYSLMKQKIQASLQVLGRRFSMNMCFVRSMRLHFPACAVWIMVAPISP